MDFFLQQWMNLTSHPPPPSPDQVAACSSLQRCAAQKHTCTPQKTNPKFLRNKNAEVGLIWPFLWRKTKKGRKKSDGRNQALWRKSSALVQKAGHNKTQFNTFNLRLYPVIINGHLFLPLYNQKTTSTSDTEHENIKGFYSLSMWLWHLVALMALHKTISISTRSLYHKAFLSNLNIHTAVMNRLFFWRWAHAGSWHAH